LVSDILLCFLHPANLQIKLFIAGVPVERAAHKQLAAAATATTSAAASSSAGSILNREWHFRAKTVFPRTTTGSINAAGELGSGSRKNQIIDQFRS
jgi:hypothetical protein